MENNNSIIFNNGIVKILANHAINKCTCTLCGEKIFGGDERFQNFTPTHPNGESVHRQCLRRMWDSCDTYITHNNKISSNNCENHTLEVIADVYNIPYFNDMNFKVLPYSPTHRRFVTEEKNGYKTGHIVKTCLKIGTKVTLNGVEIHTFEDYKSLLATV